MRDKLLLIRYFIPLLVIKGCLDANSANRVWVSTHVAMMTTVPFMSPDEALQVLDSSYIPEGTKKVMTEAFSESPSHVYIFRGTKDYRTSALERLFERNLRLATG